MKQIVTPTTAPEPVVAIPTCPNLPTAPHTTTHSRCHHPVHPDHPSSHNQPPTLTCAPAARCSKQHPRSA